MNLVNNDLSCHSVSAPAGCALIIDYCHSFQALATQHQGRPHKSRDTASTRVLTADVTSSLGGPQATRPVLVRALGKQSQKCVDVCVCLCVLRERERDLC